MAQRTVFCSPDHKPMAEFLTTRQVCIDISFTIGHPDPPHAFRRTPQVRTGLSPDLRLSGPFQPLLRRFSWLTTWCPHIGLLIPYPQHLDWAPLALVLWGVWPAHTQDS